MHKTIYEFAVEHAEHTEHNLYKGKKKKNNKNYMFTQKSVFRAW